MSIKIMYEFDVLKETQVKEEEKALNAEGQEITILKEVTKEVPVRIGLLKPNRILFDEAELYHGARLAEGLMAGLMSKALLEKRYKNDGGVLSNFENEQFTNLYYLLFEKQNDLQRKSLKEESLRTEEEKEEIKKLLIEIGKTRTQLQDFEASQIQLFNQTAENRAKIKTILWWILYLGYYKNEAGEWTPFFEGDSIDEKLSFYDEKEENGDVFYYKAFKKISTFISFWYHGRVVDKESFKDLENDINNGEI
jgi:hypothetical protein